MSLIPYFSHFVVSLMFVLISYILKGSIVLIRLLLQCILSEQAIISRWRSNILIEERNGSVIELCLTRDRGVAGSSLTRGNW